jgi:hypothetical protein
VPAKIINLEEGHPTVNVGLLRLDRAIVAARAQETPVLKLIHGYGSTGVGGRLREEVWTALDRFQRNGMIRSFIPGEEFRISDERTWALIQQDKAMKQDRDLGRGNRGITIVVV